jgi:hypothetical protein
MFEEFPEINAVCPKMNSIPQSVGRSSWDVRKRPCRGMAFQLEGRKKNELAKTIDGVIGGQGQPVKFEELRWHLSVQDGKKQAYFTLW